jgi:hypothetical protein
MQKNARLRAFGARASAATARLQFSPVLRALDVRARSGLVRAKQAACACTPADDCRLLAGLVAMFGEPGGQRRPFVCNAVVPAGCVRVACSRGAGARVS